MLNLRDLIYGADPSRVDQNNVPSVGLSSDGNVFDQVSNDDDYRPLGRIMSDIPIVGSKRKMHKVYLESPQIKYPHLNSHFNDPILDYIKFPSPHDTIKNIHNKILRNLWYESCYGGDIDAATKLFIRMICKSNCVDKKSSLSMLAHTSIQFKLSTKRRDTVCMLLNLFLEVYLANGMGQSGLELVTKYCSHPAVSYDPCFLAYVSVLHCMMAVHESYGLLSTKRSIGPGDSSILSRGVPTYKELCRNPILFRINIHVLQSVLGDRGHSSVSSNKQTVIRKLLKDVGYSLKRALSIPQNRCCVDLVGYHAAYLHATKSNKEAWNCLRQLLAPDNNNNNNNNNVNRDPRRYQLVISYLVSCRPHDRARLIRYIVEWTKSSHVGNRDLDANHIGVSCCIYLYQISCLSRAELAAILCNYIETTATCAGNNSHPHLRLVNYIFWKSLASLLGPLAPVHHGCPIMPDSEVDWLLGGVARDTAFVHEDKMYSWVGGEGQGGTAVCDEDDSDEEAPRLAVRREPHPDRAVIDSFKMDRMWWRTSQGTIFHFAQNMGTCCHLTTHCMGVALYSIIEAMGGCQEAVERMSGVGVIDMKHPMFEFYLTPRGLKPFSTDLVSSFHKSNNQSLFEMDNTDQSPVDSSEAESDGPFQSFTDLIKSSFDNYWQEGDETRGGDLAEGREGGSTAEKGSAINVKAERERASSPTGSGSDDALDWSGDEGGGEEGGEVDGLLSANGVKGDLIWNEITRLCHTLDDNSPTNAFRLLPEKDDDDDDVTELTEKSFTVQKCKIQIFVGAQFIKIRKLFPRFGPPTTDTAFQSVLRLHNPKYFRLGGGLMELLCFQIVAMSHLHGNPDSYFATFAAQTIVQNALNEDNESALNCMAYLQAMNYDVVRSLRLSTLMALNEVDGSFPPASNQSVDGIGQERSYLDSNNGTEVYIPM